MKLSIVIPVFNEEAVLEMTHQQVVSIADDFICRRVIDDFEIIYVDDGSSDHSLEILQELANKSRNVKVIVFSRNFGHQQALAAGIIHAAGDAIVSLDADLQDPPALIETMLAEYRQGYDIVYAVRQARHRDSVWKRRTARGFYRIMEALGVNIIYDHADYRLISRKVAEAFKHIPEVNLFLRGIFPFLGFKHALVYYDRQERAAGETKYPLMKMLAFAWEGITSFSVLPLRLASLLGLIVSLLSVGLTVWALYTHIRGRTIPGWSSIAIPVFFVGGLNMLFVGLIGEYIGKIYLEVKKRPLFVIDERHNFKEEVQHPS